MEAWPSFVPASSSAYRSTLSGPCAGHGARRMQMAAASSSISMPASWASRKGRVRCRTRAPCWRRDVGGLASPTTHAADAGAPPAPRPPPPLQPRQPRILRRGLDTHATALSGQSSAPARPLWCGGRLECVGAVGAAPDQPHGHRDGQPDGRAGELPRRPAAPRGDELGGQRAARRALDRPAAREAHVLPGVAEQRRVRARDDELLRRRVRRLPRHHPAVGARRHDRVHVLSKQR